MRFLLINPPYALTEPPQIPMGLQYIGGALLGAGVEVRVLDLLVRRSEPDVLLEAIHEFQPDIVGTSAVTMNWLEASQILRWAKQANPNILTVAGGPHVSFTWEEIGQKDPWVDYLVLGEGEKTIVEFVKEIEKQGYARQIAGLVWREGGDFKRGPQRELESNIDALPKPARHLFPLWRYRTIGTGIGITTSRGCPFSCIFCVGPKMVGRKPRLVPPSVVVDEIEEVMRAGFRRIAFSDDHFGMKRSHAMAVCDEIIARGLDIDLSVFIRADSAEPELLERMRKAGCTYIHFGAESGVQEIVDRVKKKVSLELIKERVHLALSMGFQLQVSMILGLPGETPETIEQTFEYARGLGSFVGIHILSPLPGSEVFERAEEYGIRILHRDWSRYDANHVVTETTGLSASKFEEIARQTEEKFHRLDEMETKAFQRGELSPSRLASYEHRRRGAFFYGLLKQGFFDDEDYWVDTTEDGACFDALTERAAHDANCEKADAKRWLRGAIDAGDLIMARSDGSTRLGFREEWPVAVQAH